MIRRYVPFYECFDVWAFVAVEVIYAAVRLLVLPNPTPKAVLAGTVGISIGWTFAAMTKWWWRNRSRA